MDKKPKPVSAIPPFGLRMQPALKASLEESAKQNARSLNAEIVARLENSTNEAGSISDSQLAMLRVLKTDDYLLLKNRVLQLGGTDEVLNTPVEEIKKRLEGPGLKRSQTENESYFSRIVGQTPLTAILSSEEINTLATRIIQSQEAQERLAASSQNTADQSIPATEPFSFAKHKSTTARKAASAQPPFSLKPKK